MDLTGIQNVGEFYSHHYLDALLEGDLKGLLARWREEDEATPDKRVNALATAFFAAKSRSLRERRPQDRYHPSHAFHVDLLEALGYPYTFDVRYLLDGSAVPVLSAIQRDGHAYLWIVETPFVDPDAAPLEQGLLTVQYPLTADETGVAVPTAPWEDVIGELFRCDEPPRWLILLAGRWVYLLDRTKWGAGQYLLFDLDELFGRRQRETIRAVTALLARDALCPDDGLPLHDTLDENSHKHAYAVSSDLKYGLRRAVELLANEYVWYQRNVAKQALFQDETLARRLTTEALRYLYRLLFLFYAEARGAEMDVVPMRSDAYRTGYSLEMLRDLEQTPLTTPQAQNGAFIDASLRKLFTLVNEGFGQDPTQLALSPQDQVYHEEGFSLPGLHNPLFDPASTPLLSSVRFRNVVLQEVIQLLSLSRESRGKKAGRGRISYAQLGINQLGAVYEGLLSYSGFFAHETLYEVKPADAQAADETAQTYFVPESDLKRYEPDEFVYASAQQAGGSSRGQGDNGVKVRKSYPKGSFIFRLAGRDREKSASYYTPEVLTQCVVKYSLKELLQGKTADEILELTVCEMALGSGAFGNEAINQLADAYLERKQAELDVRLSADDYRAERQRVKAALAIDNFYGVDLNPTAVELAQVSLWLNILHPGATAPWFGPRLAVGNSLIGARRQVYRAEDVVSGAYREKAPEADDKVTGWQGDKVTGHASRPPGSVYHFLLPDAGMAAFDGDKVIKDLAPGEVQAIKEWRKGFVARMSADEVRNLQALSDRVDALWAQALAERQTMLARTRQRVPVWGQDPSAVGNSQFTVDNSQFVGIASAERELAYLRRPTGPYRRLKLAMDYWCSLWFWPIPEAGTLPARKQFLDDLNALLQGDEAGYEPVALAEQRALWDLDTIEAPSAIPRSSFTRSRSEAAWIVHPSSVDVDILKSENPRLAQAATVAERMRFHHWELAFPEVFAERGGFDLIVGNPPWVKLQWNEGGILSDYNPLLVLRKMSASDIAHQRDRQLNQGSRATEYMAEYAETSAALSFLNAFQSYPSLIGIQTNLYKCFITRAWDLGSPEGVAGFLHPEGIYDDPKGGRLRSQAYPRLRAHFQFHNELNLFADVDHHVIFSINVYRTMQLDSVGFDHLVNLFHPVTVDQCFVHDGAGAVPGIKNDDDQWELRGHRSRIVRVGKTRLALFAGLYDKEGASAMEARLPAVHAEEIVTVLEKFDAQPHRLRDYQGRYFYSRMWEETAAQSDGTMRRDTSFPLGLGQWILSGPHFYVATPFNKTPNEGCKHNLDYSDVDLTAISDDYLPRTNYVPACSADEYLRRTPRWNDQPVTNFYRQFFRAMLSITGARTLVGCIAPRAVGHTNAIKSFAFNTSSSLVAFSAVSSSIACDFFIKSTGKQNLHDLPDLLPIPHLSDAHRRWLYARTLRLNCLTTHYADLWQELYDPAFNQDGWSKQDPRLKPWTALTPHWQRDVALRTPFERRQALVEIDVLAALALGLTLDELLTIYRVQFPVLQKNERRLRFDQRGMEVPVKTVQGELGVDEAHEKFAAMIPPFTPVDREADYREAWAYFSALAG